MRLPLRLDDRGVAAFRSDRGIEPAHGATKNNSGTGIGKACACACAEAARRPHQIRSTAERLPRRTLPVTSLRCPLLADRRSGAASDVVEQTTPRPVSRHYGYPIDLMWRRRDQKMGKATGDAIGFRWRLAIAMPGRNAIDVCSSAEPPLDAAVVGSVRGGTVPLPRHCRGQRWAFAPQARITCSSHP